MDQSLKQFVDEVLVSHGTDRGQVIALMQDIQAKYRYLPADSLRYAAEKLGMSAADIYGVATFYENFSLEPKGKYVIKCCNGTACHVRKSADVQEALYKATGLTPEDHMSADGLFTIERVACLGACGLAPVCTVNDVVHPAMTPEKAYQMIAEIKEAEGK